MRINNCMERQVVLYRPPSLPATPAGKPTSHAASSERSRGFVQANPDIEAKASIPEQISFSVMCGVAYWIHKEHLEGLKASIRKLPPPDWFDRFTSVEHSVRASAYWSNRDRKEGVVWCTSWERLRRDVLDGHQTTALIEFHCVLSRLFGDMPYNAMMAKAAERVEILSAGKVKRRYIARILRDSYVSNQTISGSCHQREAGYIQGVVEIVREMYSAVCDCLGDPTVRQKLARIPRKYYQEFLPKKALRSERLDQNIASIAQRPGSSLWENFKSSNGVDSTTRSRVRRIRDGRFIQLSCRLAYQALNAVKKMWDWAVETLQNFPMFKSSNNRLQK